MTRDARAMIDMNRDETQIYEILRPYKQTYVSVSEISKNLKNRKLFNEDRNWARPILRRMEVEGLLESNPFGEYRIPQKETDTTFKQALKAPNPVPLGDTTIISLEDVEDEDLIL